LQQKAISNNERVAKIQKKNLEAPREMILLAGWPAKSKEARSRPQTKAQEIRGGKIINESDSAHTHF